jgi:hypothetical protein
MKHFEKICQTFETAKLKKKREKKPLAATTLLVMVSKIF